MQDKDYVGIYDKLTVSNEKLKNFQLKFNGAS